MGSDKTYHVYILASEPYGTLYIGVTSALVSRVHKHRTKADPASFTARYDVTRLTYFEAYDDAENAILREKRLKKWRRDWKIDLIEQHNPKWDDLYDGLL